MVNREKILEQYANIPEELRKHRRWLLLRKEYRPGDPKPTKIPYNAGEYLRQREEGQAPGYLKASSMAPSTWSSFNKALEAFSYGEFSGIGFVLGPGQDGIYFAGVDLDNCLIDGKPGETKGAIIQALDSYTDISPSGTGTHTILQADPTEILETYIQKSDGIEIYGEGRYFTMTGELFPSVSPQIEARQAQLENIVKALMPKRQKAQRVKGKAQKPTGADEAVLEYALWDDEWLKEVYNGTFKNCKKKADGETNDWSSVIASVVNHIAKYTKCPEQIERLVQGSEAFAESGWEDKKWERLGDGLIDYAIANTDDYCKWRYDDFLKVKLDTVNFTIGGEAKQMPNPPKDFQEPNPDAIKPKLGYEYKPLTFAELDKQVYKREWLIEQILVKDQPCIIGGPKKSLKTNIIADLVTSIGSGTPFLGIFDSHKHSVSFLSGESGEGTIQETIRRICKFKGIALADVNAEVSFALPQLSQDEQLDTLINGLAKRKIEVCVIDPLYLCLLSGSEGKSAANLFDMGPLLAKVGNGLKSIGCTPLMIQHARKFREMTNPHDPMDLEDLAFAGVQEYARQWILLNRRSKFEPYAPAELWLSNGGSVGHGGLWAIDVDEGALLDDFTGRIWKPTVMDLDEAKIKANLKKEKKKATVEDGYDAELLKALDDCGNVPTLNSVMKLLGWNPAKFDRVVNRLIDKGIVITEMQVVERKNGAKHKVQTVMRA